MAFDSVVVPAVSFDMQTSTLPRNPSLCPAHAVFSTHLSVEDSSGDQAHASLLFLGQANEVMISKP